MGKEVGKPSGRNAQQKLCSYILQDDNLYPFFTVNEAMLIAANLKISNRSMNLEEKQILIDQILDTLHLSFAKDTRCINLSGGQKKRLSIALELIDDSPILFLDEPTTWVFVGISGEFEWRFVSCWKSDEDSKGIFEYFLIETELGVGLTINFCHEN